MRFFPANVRFLPCLAVIAGFAACPQAASAGSLVPAVLVTAAPLQPIVDALVKGITASQLLTRPGQDAHTVALSPSQAKALDAADIVIMPDAAINSAVGQLAQRKAAHGAVIIQLTALPGADPLPYGGPMPWLHGDDEAHAHDESGAVDPHLWMDPIRIADLLPPLADAIAAKAPSHRALLQRNAASLARHLRQEVHPHLQAMLQRPPAAKPYATRDYFPYLTSHQAYQYFLTRYGLPNPGALGMQPEEMLGARTAAGMLQRAETVEVGCLIAEQETKLVQKVAKLTGARIVLLSPERLIDGGSRLPLPWIHNGYDRLLYETARRFSECLQK